MFGPISAIGQNPSYERNARKINFFANPQVMQPVGTPAPEQNGIAAINGELTPTYEAQGSTHTNGLGHSKHTFMMMF